MNTGQALLTIGALMLITVLVINFQRTASTTNDELDNNRFRLEAASIMTSRIEQLSQYYFDEVTTDTSSEKGLSNFTTSANLGFDGNDGGVPDDIDDFNARTVSDTGQSGVVYHTRYVVDYVSLNATTYQLVNSTNRTWHKRVAVSVTDVNTPPLLFKYVNGVAVRDTLQLRVVVSYWFYN